MINPLKVASAGYLKRASKAVLIIAVAGYLNFQGIPPIPPTPPRPQPNGGMGIGYAQPQEKDWKEERKKILRDDEEILYIIVKALQKLET